MTQFAYDPYLPVRQSNGLAIAGFICSLLGIFTVGLLSPVGLILSLAALGRQPRGFAVAGLVLGLVGTCGGILVVAAILLIGLVGLAAAFGVLMLSNPEKVELTTDMLNIAIAVDKYRDENHYLPAGLGLLHLRESLTTDPWQTAYRYVQKDPKNEFDIESAGPDKKFDTADDIALSKIGETWKPAGRIHFAGGRGRGGALQIDLGNGKVDIAGDEKSGTVKVQVGDRTIEIRGDDKGGTIDLNAEKPATEPAEPAAPEAPEGTPPSPPMPPSPAPPSAPPAAH